jgi:hypothetical protein
LTFVGTGHDFTIFVFSGSVAIPASDMILAHPDFSKKFILDTDAGNEAIGAVLSQEIDGKERPIAFASLRCCLPGRCAIVIS